MAKNLKRSASVVEDATDSDTAVQITKKSKSTAASAEPSGNDDEGNPYWELSNKRRVGVSHFKQNIFVNIREFYEKDGKTLPGKKGISLSIEQYNSLLKAVPGINAALGKLGHQVGDLDENASKPPATTPKERKPKPPKANIDATSDEESE